MWSGCFNWTQLAAKSAKVCVMEQELEENVGASLDSFAEREEVQALLDRLPSVCTDLRELERAEERFTGSVKRCVAFGTCAWGVI